MDENTTMSREMRLEGLADLIQQMQDEELEKLQLVAEGMKLARMAGVQN